MKASVQEMKYSTFPNLLNHIFYDFKLKTESDQIFNTEKEVPQKDSSEPTFFSKEKKFFKNFSPQELPDNHFPDILLSFPYLKLNLHTYFFA